MRKWLKWLLAAGILACLLGIGMLTAGAMKGGVDQLKDLSYIQSGAYGMAGRIYTEIQAAADEGILYQSERTEYTAVRNLKIEVVGAGRVRLYELDHEELPEHTVRVVHTGIGNNETLYELEINGDTLDIRLPADWKGVFGHWDVEDLDIFIPAGYQFDSVKIECVSGELDADALYAQKLSIENISGSVYIRGGRAGALDLECLSGTTECFARIGREADVECTSGEVDITMNDSWQSYDYKWSCFSGTITADGRELGSGHGKAGEQKMNYGTGRQVKLECISGTINVNYANES